MSTVPSSHRAPWSIVAAVFGICFLVTGVFKSRALSADSYMTLYAGRLVSEQGVPRVDTLTVEGAGREWFNQQWLAQWVFFRLYELGGYPLVAITSAALVASGFAIIALLLRNRGVSGFRILTWTLFAFVVALSAALIRAQSFAYPLFALTLLVLVPLPAGPQFAWRILVLLPLLVLWANVHGSVLVGIGLVAIWAVVRTVQAFSAGYLGSAGAYAAVAAVAPLTMFATPYGFEILSYYESVIANPIIKVFITEWQPASFGDLKSIPPLFFAMILLFVIAWGRGRRIGLPPLLTLATVGTTVATLLSVRHQAWMGMVGAVLVTHILESGEERKDGTSENRTRPRAWAGWFVGGCTAATALLVLLTTSSATYLSQAPQEGIDEIAKYMSTHRHAEVIADESTSGALLWRYPDLAGKVAFDPRLELYSIEDLARWFVFVTMSSPDWRETFDDYEIAAAFGGQPGALVKNGNPQLARKLGELAAGDDWRRLPSGAAGTVIVAVDNDPQR